jgi:hypothetical protein
MVRLLSWISAGVRFRTSPTLMPPLAINSCISLFLVFAVTQMSWPLLGRRSTNRAEHLVCISNVSWQRRQSEGVTHRWRFCEKILQHRSETATLGVKIGAAPVREPSNYLSPSLVPESSPFLAKPAVYGGHAAIQQKARPCPRQVARGPTPTVADLFSGRTAGEKASMPGPHRNVNADWQEYQRGRFQKFLNKRSAVNEKSLIPESTLRHRSSA